MQGSWDLNLSPELELHLHRIGLASEIIQLLCPPWSQQTQGGWLSCPSLPLPFAGLSLEAGMGWDMGRL